MTSWEIKRTSKGLKLFIFTVVSLLGFNAHVLHNMDINGRPYKINLMAMAIQYIPVFIAWFTVVPAAIIRKRIPLKIEFDENHMITIHYPNNKIKQFEKGWYAYTYHRYTLYSVLVIHRKILARRGHIVYRPSLNLTALFIGSGWKMKTVDEIATYLTKEDIERRDIPDKLFLTRLLEE